MKSKYAGHCKVCGKAIAKGANISRNRAGVWVHVRCSDRPRPVLASRPSYSNPFPTKVGTKSQRLAQWNATYGYH